METNIQKAVILKEIKQRADACVDINTLIQWCGFPSANGLAQSIYRNRCKEIIRNTTIEEITNILHTPMGGYLPGDIPIDYTEKYRQIFTRTFNLYSKKLNEAIVHSQSCTYYRNIQLETVLVIHLAEIKKSIF